jgi:hypothetical protein
MVQVAGRLRSIGWCVWEFGQQDVSSSEIKELSKGNLKSMLWNVAWRRVKDGWLKELSEKPSKLC